MRRPVRSVRPSVSAVVALGAAAGTGPAALGQADNHHFMQVEQVIAGVNGDTTAQAVQLRMRQNNQGVTIGSRVTLHDAAGGNPVVLANLTRNMSNALAGDRILIATPGFSNYTDPPAVPDFVMAAPIANLGAGRIVFESVPTIWWSLAWGGAAYTGSNAGSIANDPDGNFGPPFPGPLPSATLQALQFPGPAGALSTTNANDYRLTAGAAVFQNNARARFTVVPPPCYPDCDTSTGPGVLDIFDFLCFQNAFDALDPYACGCDTSTGPNICDIFDFLCFQNAFDAGCP